MSLSWIDGWSQCQYDGDYHEALTWFGDQPEMAFAYADDQAVSLVAEFIATHDGTIADLAERLVADWQCRARARCHDAFHEWARRAGVGQLLANRRAVEQELAELRTFRNRTLGMAKRSYALAKVATP